MSVRCWRAELARRRAAGVGVLLFFSLPLAAQFGGLSSPPATHRARPGRAEGVHCACVRCVLKGESVGLRVATKRENARSKVRAPIDWARPTRARVVAPPSLPTRQRFKTGTPENSYTPLYLTHRK